MPCRRRGKKDQEEDDETRLVQRAESKRERERERERERNGRGEGEKDREREDGWNAPIAIELASVNRARIIITRARVMTKL